MYPKTDSSVVAGVVWMDFAARDTIPRPAVVYLAFLAIPLGDLFHVDAGTERFSPARPDPTPMDSDADVVGALDAGTGLTCVVGAGGKKTTLYTLAPRIDRAAITATVRIPIFDGRTGETHVTDDPVSAVRGANAWPVGVVPEREGDRYLGYGTAVVDELAASDAADAVLVKADGARTRWLKAPKADEPRIPETADTVVPIASARVVGEPLTEERVHRPDRVAEVTGLDAGDEIGAADVAAVLASEDGGRKDVPDGAAVIPLVNMVDDDALEAVGREIAEAVMERTDVPRVVLARMIDEEPVVDVLQ